MPFEPGQSGNPTGRRAGLKDRRSQIKDMLTEAGPELLERAFEMARAGDTTLMSKCLDLTIAKPREAKFVGGLGLAGLPYKERMEKLQGHLDNEKIDLDTWKTMRDSYMREFELIELNDRLEVLEKNAGIK